MKGQIYKLTSPHTDMIYIGSTSQGLKQRLCEHNSKSIARYVSSKILIEFGDVSIHLIREVEFETQLDLRKLEQIEMDKYDGELCNKKRAYRTPVVKKELRKKYRNIDNVKKYNKEYADTDKCKAYRNSDKYKQDRHHYNYWNRQGGLRAISILKPLFHDI